MALTFALSSAPTFTNLVMSIVADGVSTTLTIDLTIPPFSFDLRGNLPVSLTGVVPVPSGFTSTATLNSDRKSITITITPALAAGSGAQASLDLLFAGA